MTSRAKWNRGRRPLRSASESRTVVVDSDRRFANQCSSHLQSQSELYNMRCITYSTDYYQRLTLKSWFTNVKQTPVNRSQQLPAPYKRLTDEIK